MKRTSGDEVKTPKRIKNGKFEEKHHLRVLELFKNCRDSFLGLEKLDLLKKIEEKSQEWFEQLFLADFVASERTRAVQIICNADFSSVQEFSEEFYYFLDLGHARNECTRIGIELAFDKVQHGFDEFDVVLICGGCQISRAYGVYYESWGRAMNDPALVAYLKRNPPAKDSPFHSAFTVIKLDNSSLSYLPYAEAFEVELTPVISAVEELIHSIKSLNCDDHGYIKFLEQYLACFKCKEVDQLLEMNVELDRRWMQLQYWIQFIHDIEEGYCDPLNAKSIPELCIRFEDSKYQQANSRIRTLQSHMVSYFRARQQKLAVEGIKALTNSRAAVFYVPFHCACSLHNRSVGQCIPNRSEVKEEFGIKIFLDITGLASGIEICRQTIRRLFTDSERLCSILDAEENLVYLTATHEIGHAIYNLESIPEAAADRLSTVFEEPRVELCCLFTLKLLREKGVIDTEFMKKITIAFLIGEIRRFAAADNLGDYPYFVSSMNMYKLAHKVQLVSISADKERLEIHDSKVESFLEEVETLFLQILDLEDNCDIAKLTDMMQNFENRDHELIQFILQKFEH